MSATVLFRSSSCYTNPIFACCRCTKILRKYFSDITYGGTKEDWLLNKSLVEYDDIKLSPLRIRACVFERSFSDARLDVIQYLEDTNGNIKDPTWILPQEIDEESILTRYINFSSLFTNGFQRVKAANDGFMDTYENSLDRQILSTVHCLKNIFLKNMSFHTECLRELRIPGPYYELKTSKLMALLASHLFSPLVSKNNEEVSYYITDEESGKYFLCPCPSHSCHQEIIYKKAGIGSEYLWYGRPDIMVFPTVGSVCNIVVAKPGDKEDFMIEESEPESIDGPILEAKRVENNLRNEGLVQRVVSQTITSSFFQRNYQLTNDCRFPSLTTLIPTIAVCDSAFDIYFYDSENDILLRNMDPLPLWDDYSSAGIKKKFNMSSVLALWMAINHLSFQPCLRPFEIQKLERSCGLSHQIESVRMKKVNETLNMREEFTSLRGRIPALQVPIRPPND